MGPHSPAAKFEFNVEPGIMVYNSYSCHLKAENGHFMDLPGITLVRMSSFLFV